MKKSALGALFLTLCIGTITAEAATRASAGSASRSAAKKTIVKKTAAPPPRKRKVVAAKEKTTRTTVVSQNSREKIVKQVSVVNGKRKVSYEQVTARRVMPSVAPVLTAGDLAGLNRTHDPLELKSNVALVVDESSSEVLFEKNPDIALPIASITKLMTGLVVVESNQNMEEVLEVTTDDIDRLKNSASRLAIGTRLSRANLLHLALMSSENRAASALGRNYPGGLPAFVAAMNAKARVLGMRDTHFVDSNGLSSGNVASARDLAKLVVAAQKHPILGQYSTAPDSVVASNGRSLQYRNTNHLVNNPNWEIGLQKTGYIAEAGRCLVMQTYIRGRSIVMVFLDSKGKESRLGDAARIRRWIEAVKFNAVTTSVAAGGNG
ncbi:D-alanyl-D-alanine endopeptidase (penicillin-binding protein 7) [Paucimonas lemoignei]|uniref:D-alanyl-D-alanine endopeptidase (Penicillin-binding protein 7) n=1 Tax=Paucimonas lemoignei TaxID=29443 RepID=A0A4R3HWW2_PAULE|nr:D-alanyl-D-alanine endopeptidase [Paucimonas lemoignei]TCS36635.1 D-alanyl-D-alanine endopeptidase (penicillin-binding protein 7) [Paucimonas lemoignei]